MITHDAKFMGATIDTRGFLNLHLHKCLGYLSSNEGLHCGAGLRPLGGLANYLSQSVLSGFDRASFQISNGPLTIQADSGFPPSCLELAPWTTLIGVGVACSVNPVARDRIFLLEQVFRSLAYDPTSAAHSCWACCPCFERKHRPTDNIAVAGGP